MNDEEWYDRIDDPVLPIISDEDGSIYVLPVSQVTNGVVYNKTVLENAGVNVGDIRTMDDFKDACEKIKASGVTPFFVGGKDTWTAAVLYNAMAPAFYTTEGCKYPSGKELKDGTFDWDTKGSCVLEEIADMVQAGYFNKDLVTADNAATLTALGEDACGFSTEVEIVKVLNVAPDAQLGIMPIPCTTEEGKSQYMIGEGSCFGIWTLPEGAGLVIYFPDGTPAYATEARFITEQDDMADTKELMGRKVKIEGDIHYLYHMKEEKYGFQIDYMLPHSTILREANHTSFVILLFWFCAMAAAFFIFMNLSRRISVSTERIVSYIQKYRLGDEESSGNMPAIPIEEFSEISLAMTEMTERITDLVQHEYIWKMNQQMAEYKAMQAEINPHFFYNVMNSLQALNRIGDTKNLEKGILNLSRMFRYTCEPGYDSTVQKECRFIESYLMLVKIRFEERLYYDIQVEEQLQDFSIPKLLLQPLIENAMRHGMAQDGSSLSIVLRVCQVESKNGMAFV